MIQFRQHLGVVLHPSDEGFDRGGATFACIITDPSNKYDYLYYTGSTDATWTKASIGVAKRQDGVCFQRYSGNPLISIGDQSVTPSVFRTPEKYWMVFAFRPKMRSGRRLGIATADDPLGPWEFVDDLIVSRDPWEGGSIDIGPSLAKLNEQEYLIYYSNVPNNGLRNAILHGRHWRRRIGILRLFVSGSKVRAERWTENPLDHLNGARGAWNESLFCPGYFVFGDKHYLLPAAATYSVGFPYRQYIGSVEDSSPYFESPNIIRPLVSGTELGRNIIAGLRGEIALDSPCPVLRSKDRVWLYYSVMDRDDGLWKTALSVFAFDAET